MQAADAGSSLVKAMLWLSCLGAFAVNGFCQESGATDSAEFRAIDKYVTARMRSARIPGLTMGIVKGDQIIYLKGYGRADDSGRPATPQTPFMIGSITKSFTALAVMQLVDAGKIDLDAPVQRYLPWFRVRDPEASAQITVRHLLTMTSGIPQSYETQLWTEQDDRALERTVRLLGAADLTGPVGRSFGYSNADYETLGMIVQTVSGLSYEEYAKQRIFTPLAMRNSFVSQDEAMRHGMASGYRWWFGIPVAVTLPYNRSELPAGYIIASTEDMTHFVIAEMNGGRYGTESVLSARSMALRHVVAKGYGLGWEFLRVNGRQLINVDGGTANFQASLFIDPAANVGVYIAANVVSALDAFSSPSGSTSLDGATTRGMAATVLSIVTKQPLPNEGPGHERLTLTFDLVIAVLTAALVIWVARTPMRLRSWADRGIVDTPALARRIGAIVVLNSALAIALLYLTLNVPAWKVIVEFQPDLGYWLDAVAAVLLIKGLVEVLFVTDAHRRVTRSSVRDVSLTKGDLDHA